MTSEAQNLTTNNSTTTTDEFLDGVRMLLDRMEACPQDFLGEDYANMTQPRFAYICRGLENMLKGNEPPTWAAHLTKEEKTALLLAHRKMMRQAFTAQVIAQTFDTEPIKETLTVKSADRYSFGATDPRGFGAATAKREGARVAPYAGHLERARDAHLDAHRLSTSIAGWANDELVTNTCTTTASNIISNTIYDNGSS